MHPILHIGPLAIQLPGLIYLLGLWMGTLWTERQAVRLQMDANILYNLVFYTLIAGVISARLSFAAQNMSAFTASPLSLFSLNPGLFDPWGGLGGGLIVALIYGNRNQLNWWITLDSLVPLFTVLMVAIPLANLASGNGYGKPTDLPWAIDLWGTQRHPTQIYESTAAIFVLILFWRAEAFFTRLNAGEKFLSFLSISAFARIFLETFRGDSGFLPLGLRTNQVIVWLVLAVCLWGFYQRHDWGMNNPRESGEKSDTI